MALQIQDLMLRLSPVPNTNLGMGGGEDLAMERQRLQLLKDQFEETKRKNLEEEEYRRMAEAAQTKRAELAVQKEREQQAGQAAAANLAARQTALTDFGKRYDAGDHEGMSVAAERLNQLGGYARRLDTGGPFPAWQVDLEPPKPPPGLSPMDSLGYGTLGTPDSLPETEQGAAPALSTEDAFRQAGSIPAEGGQIG